MKQWPTKPLEVFFATKSGSVDPSKFPDEKFDLYSIPAFDAGTPEVRSGSEIGSTKQIVCTNDMLLSRIVPHIRRAWVVGADNGRRIIASGEWIVFRSPQMNPHYLRYFLIGDPFHQRFMQTVSGVGGSLLRAKTSEVGKICIPVPPLAEQERIVKLLDEADELRKLRAKSDRRTATLIPALFHEMFGNPVTNPQGFPIAELREFLAFITSGSRGWAKHYAAEGSRFIRSLNVRMNHISDDDAVFVRPPAGAEANRTRVNAHDVLLTITGSQIGRVATVPKRLDGAYISQHVAILRLKPGILPVYASVFLSLDIGGQFQITQLQYGQTKPGLNLDQIRGMRIPLPPISIQQQFVQRVAEIRELEAGQAASRLRLNNLFQSLLHSAFDGEL